MGRSPETPTAEAVNERVERDIRSGGRRGVAVREVTSPTAPPDGAPDRRRPRRGPVLVGVAVVLIAAGVAAMLVLGRGTGDKSSATPVPGPSFTIDTAAPTTVDPEEAVRAAVIRDYLASQAAYDEAIGGTNGGPPNPDLPALKTYMVGQELISVRAYIIGMQAAGLTALGPPAQLHPRVVRVQGNTAIVDDCYTSDGHIVDAKTHALRDAPGTTKAGLESTLQLDSVSGLWKVADSVKKPELCAAS